MPLPFSSRPLLALPLMAPLFGCASKPAEPPIVLRPPHAAKSAVHRPPRSKQETRTVSAPANRAAGSAAAEAEPEPPAGTDQKTLSTEQKDALFRDFDAYLNQPGRH